MNLWINNIIIDWEANSESAMLSSPNSITLTYELWEHAESILSNNQTNNYLSDAIINLNKAIGLRIKALNQNYHFNNSPFKTKDKKILGQLEEFGLIGPKLLNEITTLRNNIEHNDNPPPTHKKCLDYLEICWYFLKATDLHVLETKDSIIFTNPNNNKYWVSFEIDFDKNWHAELRGWLPPSLISFSEFNDSIKVISKKYQNRADFLNSLDKKKYSDLNDEDDTRGQNPNDITFSGIISQDNKGFKNILVKYFKTVV